MNLMETSNQWATRPDDQRFTSLEELKAAVMQRKTESWTANPKVADLRMIPLEKNKMAVELFEPTRGQRRMVEPTHWGFGQLSQYAKAPAAESSRKSGALHSKEVSSPGKTASHRLQGDRVIFSSWLPRGVNFDQK